MRSVTVAISAPLEGLKDQVRTVMEMWSQSQK